MAIEMITAVTTLNPLPTGFTARPATWGDLDAVHAFVNRCAVHDTGHPQQTAEQIRRDWELPGVDLARDMELVFAPHGALVGYRELWNIVEPRVRPYIWARVHPAYRGQGVGTYLLRAAEDRACDFLPRTPPHARFTVRGSASASVTDAHPLFENEGYDLARAFLRMEIEMDAPPPAPVWPDGITVRIMRHTEDDLRRAWAVDQDAFRDHWGFMPLAFEKWRHLIETDPHFDPTLFFFATTQTPDGEQIVGGCYCRSQTTEDPAMAFVNDLGVRRAWRRRGIGLALLRHAFGEFYRRGQRKAALGVDATSLTGALDLYRKAGMRETRRYLSYEKELRAGEELSTQTVGD